MIAPGRQRPPLPESVPFTCSVGSPTLLHPRQGADVPVRTVVADGVIWAVGVASVSSYDQKTLQAKGFTELN